MAKIIISLFVATSLVLTLVSTSNKCEDYAMQSFVNKNMALTGRYLYERVRKYPNQSYSIVTLPIACFVGHLALHTKGREQHKMMNLLGLKNKDEIMRVLPAAVSYINNESGTKSKLTFRVFEDHHEKFTKSYKQEFTDICNGSVEYVDYDCPHQAVEEVNDWYSDQSSTYAAIPLNDVDMFSANNKQGLVYATYMDFVASFDHEANPNALLDINFEVSKHRSLKFPSLYGNGYFKYAKLYDLKAEVIQMHLKGGNYAVFYYPFDPNHLTELMYAIKDPEVFYGGLDRAQWMCLKIHVTVGHAEVSNDLFEFVPELHLNGTEFENVFENGDPAHVSYGFQQLHLIGDTEVRKGQMNSKLCPGDDLPFVKMNHACAYYVLASNRMNVYAGVLYGPQNYGK